MPPEVLCENFLILGAFERPPRSMHDNVVNPALSMLHISVVSLGRSACGRVCADALRRLGEREGLYVVLREIGRIWELQFDFESGLHSRGR